MDSQSVNTETQGARRFTLVFLLLFLGVPLVLSVMHYVVNPLGYFNGLPLARPMTQAPQIYSSLRYHKAYDVWRFAPDHLVIGSSRVGFGLGGELDGYYDGGRVYNNGLPGMQIYEIARSVEHAHTIKPLQSVMLGLDFFVFNRHSPKFAGGFKPSRMLTLDQRDEAQWRLWRSQVSDVMEGLLSIDVFTAMKTRLFSDDVKKNSGITLNRNGGWGKAGKRKRQTTAAKQLAHYERIEGLYLDNVWLADGDKFELYGYDSRLNEYREMIRFAHNNNIQMRMFVTPVHGRMLVELDEMGLWGCYEQWKRELWQINRDVSKELGKPPFALWDFAGVDNWSTEDVASDERINWFVDSAHFSRSLGEIMMGTMLRGEEHGFGVRLDGSAVVEERLGQVREGLQEYRRDERMLENVRQLIAKIRKDKPQPKIGSCLPPAG